MFSMWTHFVRLHTQNIKGLVLKYAIQNIQSVSEGEAMATSKYGLDMGTE